MNAATLQQENANGFAPGDRLGGMDFGAHNAEVLECWAAYQSRRPYRIPAIVGINTRFYMLHPEANPDGLDHRAYSEDPDAMFDAQLRFQRWNRFNVLQDWELGLPDVWRISVDLQNYYDAAWLGCQVEYLPNEVPDTRPIFADAPERLMEHGIPDPFGGVMARGLEFYEHFLDRAARESYLGRPIEINPPWFGTGTDGVMTCACNLFGPTFVCETMAAEPDRLAILLGFITNSLLEKMAAWRKRVEIAFPADGFVMADDSIALISTRMFRDHVLPLVRRICDTFGTMTERGIHLCGDSTRHFPLLCEELGIQMFDTGFPVDFGRLRAELGPDIRIQGGPHVELMRTGTPGQVYAESRRILESGVLEGGLFVLREGNNLAPGTPLENTEAMVRAARETRL